jgi:hypothetical protein
VGKVHGNNLFTLGCVIEVSAKQLFPSSVSLATWFVLYLCWCHAVLESLLLIPYSTFSKRSFLLQVPLEHIFFSCFYDFTIWFLQLTVYRNFKRLVCPSIEKSLRKREGTCPSRLTGTVSDIVRMIFGLGFESVLLSRLAKEVTPSYMNLNLSQPLGTGECRSTRKAVATE